MAKELVTSIALTISGHYKNVIADHLSTPEDLLTKSFRDTLATGTGLDKADRLYHRTSTLVGQVILDLEAVEDGLTEAVDFACVKLMALFNKADVAVPANIITLGGVAGVPGDTFDTWIADPTDAVKVQPGGCFILYNPSAAGYAIAGGEADLQINRDVGDADYDLIIIGASA